MIRNYFVTVSNGFPLSGSKGDCFAPEPIGESAEVLSCGDKQPAGYDSEGGDEIRPGAA
jgi:hypothetical protein